MNPINKPLNTPTPKRHSSKAEGSKAPNSNKNVPIVKGKVDMPTPAEDKYKEIRDVNVINIKFNEDSGIVKKNPNPIKSIFNSEMKFDNIRPSTPGTKKLPEKSENGKTQSNCNNSSNNQHVKVKITQEKKPKEVKKKKRKFSKEQAARIIQKCFKRYITKIKQDPMYEMKNLLKKKKLILLQNYSNTSQIDKSNNNESSQYSKREREVIQNPKETERVTANFNFGNIQANQSNISDNTESFLSCPIKKDNYIMVDKGLEKLQKGLETVPEIQCAKVNTPEGNMNITDFDFEAIGDKEVSDTVNIYERIFKEMKKDKKLREMEADKKEATSVSKQIQVNDQREVEINRNCQMNEISNDTSSINKQLKGNLPTPSCDFEEKKKMVERLHLMLETEDTKSKIQSKLSLTDIPQSDLNIPNSNSLPQNNNNTPVSYENQAIKDETQEKISKIYKILEENSYLPPKDDYSTYQNPTHKSPNPNTAEILNMTLELKETKKTIFQMKEIIEELRRELKAKEEFHIKDLQEKLSTQKYEFDNILQRQNGIIESLLSEKKKLSGNVVELSEKLEIIEKSNHKKLQSMVENFEIETKKNKDAWFQAEKLRRKKWEDQKVKEIKEMTVKGLEPEIERLLANQKQEMMKMEDNMNEELRRQREKLSHEFEKRQQEMKERFIKEKEEALEHERTLASQRLRNQSERLEEEYNEERRRWNGNLSAEIQRLESLREKDKKLYEDQLGKIEERNSKLREDKELYYQGRISEMEKQSEEKIKNEADSWKLKLEKEKEKFIEEKSKEFEAKLKEIKIELVKDRDKQLQIVIEKLGEDTILERKKNLIDCEKKANAMNQSLLEENANYKLKLQELSDKLSAETKNRIMLDENMDVLGKKLADKEREYSRKEKQLLDINASYNELSYKYSSIAKDFNREKLDIEVEFKSQLQKNESDLKLLMEKLESVKGYYESKINDIHITHKAEIVEIDEKIKKTFSRKEEVIKKIQEEMQVKDITIQKYEEMLSKQRKELLGK